MKILNTKQCDLISAGLTEKEIETLTVKAGSYAAKATFLGLMAASGCITLSAFLVGGIGAPIASMVGTYWVYENKAYLKELKKEWLSDLVELLE